MAKLYGRGRGKARSHAPKAEKPYWLKSEAKEVEDLVVSLAKKEMPPAKIGLVLRDTYGIPSVKVVTGKKIQKILIEHGMDSKSQDVQALEKRSKGLREHFEKNKQDKVAKRGLQLTESKLSRLKRYAAKKRK
jgi:small subunit ribosomal protein S15